MRLKMYSSFILMIKCIDTPTINFPVAISTFKTCVILYDFIGAVLPSVSVTTTTDGDWSCTKCKAGIPYRLVQIRL